MRKNKLPIAPPAVHLVASSQAVPAVPPSDTWALNQQIRGILAQRIAAVAPPSIAPGLVVRYASGQRMTFGDIVMLVARSNPALAERLLQERAEAMKEFFASWSEELAKLAKLDKEAAARSQAQMRRQQAVEQRAHEALQAKLSAHLVRSLIHGERDEAPAIGVPAAWVAYRPRHAAAIAPVASFADIQPARQTTARALGWRPAWPRRAVSGAPAGLVRANPAFAGVSVRGHRPFYV